MLSSRYDIRFSGRVQGVNFRWTTFRIAEKFAVSGWVRNESDGSVRCVVEGEPAELDSFVESLQRAMAGYIADTVIKTTASTGTMVGFGIRG